ncbi:MAG: Na+/H+ antiporter NhaC [Candidatus Hydrogenedentota bacterium]
MRYPSLKLSFLPLLFLMVLLALNVAIFGDDASWGPNQLALLLAAAFTAALGFFVLGANYAELEHKALHSVILAMQAMVILLVVGVLIGLWILSGIVPAMVYYGIQLIHPTVFLVVACLACSVVSLAIGSSWSTMGTVGVALVTIGRTIGIDEPIVAGAIISGAYFGDKMSPMSDTTNLAPAVAGADLFTHIRHMFYTTVPAYAITLVLFAGIGLFQGGGDYNPALVDEVAEAIAAHFLVGWYLLLPPLFVIALVAMRVPALPALMTGALIGAAMAPVFQPHLLGAPFTWRGGYATLVETAHSGYVMEGGHEMLDKLFTQGGLLNMLPTILLIITAMLFGGMMEATNMLPCIARAILSLVRGTGTLVGATIASCILVNIAAPDQYIAIVVPGRMFGPAYRMRRLKPRNLSRALEDGGTVTSVLVPWNTCGAFASSVLRVPAIEYAPFAFFNWLSPLLSAFMAGVGIGIKYMSEDEAAQAGQEQQ